MTPNLCRKYPFYLLYNHHRFNFPFSFSLYFFSTSGTRRPLAEFLIERHGFSPETASKASSLMTDLKNYTKSDSILQYLQESGFSKAQLEGVIQRMPNILSSDLEKTIKPKIQTFRDMGFSPNDVAELVLTDPWILTRRKADGLVQSVLILGNILGSFSCVRKALKGSNWFLTRNLEKNMVPNVEFFRSCGVRQTQISSCIYTNPRFFLFKPETMKEFVKRVDELGFDRKSKLYIYAVRTVSSMSIEKWESKWMLFQELGFTNDEELTIFRRCPLVFTLSENKIRGNIDFLVSERKMDISGVLKYLQLLTMSVKRRLRPRVKVVDVLKAENLIVREPSLPNLARLSEKQFSAKYVLPHFDLVGELYTSMMS